MSDTQFAFSLYTHTHTYIFEAKIHFMYDWSSWDTVLEGSEPKKLDPHLKIVLLIYP